MPNWIRNRLVIKGNKAKEALMSIRTVDGNGNLKYPDDYDRAGLIDFDLIIPMPDVLGIVDMDIADYCVWLFVEGLTTGNTHSYFKNNDIDIIKYMKAFNKLYGEQTLLIVNKDRQKVLEHALSGVNNQTKKPMFKNEEDVYRFGQKFLDSYLECGYASWYSWSVNNWGTKWNAGYCYLPSNGKEVVFETAWDPVPKLIQQLSTRYPSCKFEYSFADEDYGSYAGRMVIKNGQIVESVNYEDFSKEAFELCFELWGNDEDYKFDKEKNTYVAVDQ